MPDKIEDKEKPPETPEPRWKEIDVIASKMESIFFEECTEKGLSPYEMSVVWVKFRLSYVTVVVKNGNIDVVSVGV